MTKDLVTEWDLKKYFYSSTNDENIKKDIDLYKDKVESFIANLICSCDATNAGAIFVILSEVFISFLSCYILFTSIVIIQYFSWFPHKPTLQNYYLYDVQL